MNSTISYFNDVIQKSNLALQELKREQFNSKTLRMLFYDPRYKTKDADVFMVQSKETHKPIKIYAQFKVHRQLDSDYSCSECMHSIKIFRNRKNIGKKDEEWCFTDKLGYKDFFIENDNNELRMDIGIMDTSANSGLNGLGCRLDEFQIKTALESGITRIPRTSYPEAILYHLKMGFIPIQEPVQVFSQKNVEKIMKSILGNFRGIDKSKFTPIIQEKGMTSKKYYLDINTTKAVASLRTVKENLERNFTERPGAINGGFIEMVLKGDALRVWKNLIEGKPMFENTGFKTNI